MNILISRYRKTSEVIDGYLTIDGSLRLYDTAENAVNSLPAGTYRVHVGKCKQYARKKPIILGAWNEGSMDICDHCQKMEYASNNSDMPVYCPQITPGNGAYNRTDGAILVGTFISPGCLKHPKLAFDNLYDRIRKSAERGHEITLTITENDPLLPARELTPYQMGCQILKQF